MTFVIMVDGKPLDPRKAAEHLLPMDTGLACPYCGSNQVQARRARTVEQFGKGSEMEQKELVPRLQDRSCLACGQRWQTVLNPTAFNDPERFR